MRRFTSLTILLYIFSYLLLGQAEHSPQNQHKFKYLSIDQGLSNNYITAICQDSKGFIWFGTQNGLNKFNGQTIVSYMNIAGDTTSVSSNLISAIYCDSKNNLWIAGSEGLDHYNADYDNFTHFTHTDVNWIISHIYTVAEDQNQKLWFGGLTGLYAYDLNTSELQYFSNKPGNPHGIPPYDIYRINVDKENRVWVSLNNGGIFLYDQEKSSSIIFQNNPDDSTSLSGNRVEKIYEDQAGNIWLGTLNNGLNLFLPESNSFKRYIPDPDNLYSTRVRAIYEDLKGNFFIGTRAGLYMLDKRDQKFIHYAFEGHNFSSLSQNSVITSFIDKTGTLWIGTFSGGVNYTNLNKKEFNHYIAGIDDNHYLSGGNIYALTEDPMGNLWVGGDNGLNYLDRSTYTFKYYVNDPNDPYSLSYNDVKSLEWDEKGNLWVGTNRGGLNYYNTKTGKFISYRNNPDDPNSIIGDKVYCLLYDKFQNLWLIVSPDNKFDSLSLDILPKGQDKFVHLKEAAYFGFDQNSNGDVYFGGVNGFWKFDHQDSVFTFISQPDYIGSVNTVKLDSKGTLWIGSNKGLVRCNLDNDSMKWYSKNNNYPIYEVYGVLEDEDYNLWVSTNSGLVKISNIVKDTANIEFKIYDHYDGLQSKQFNYNAYFKSKTGEMMFGGINGFNTFFPDKITENKTPAEVIITNLKIYNETVPIGEEVGGHVVLHKSISVTDELIFWPSHKIFTIEFAALQNFNPEKFAFKTMLVGLDKDWQYRKTGNNMVTYTNLAPGEYTFVVSAANNDGYWNENPAKIKIRVVSPYYQTWWFRVSGFLLLVGVILAIYFYRMRSIRNRNVVLEKLVQERTQDATIKNKMLKEANELLHDKQEKILLQNDELEKHRHNLTELVNERTSELEHALERAKESDALKSAFLANMSHEIRTPMNAIMGFTNFLGDEELTPEEQANYIQIIQTNSSSLLKIIDEILDLSLIESNQLALSQSTFDLNMILDNLYSYYFLNNENKLVKIIKKNTLQEQNIKLESDEQRMRQIISNLMDNAVKFTEKGIIELGATIHQEKLIIYVKDSGKGIPAKNINNIFQQFIKVEDPESVWTNGLGLGLTISQKIANALGGEIIVESELGKGSVFSLNIPLKGILSEKEISVKEATMTSTNGWQGKTILVAEDVEANFFYIKKILKNTQTNVIWAKNGKEAIDIASDNKGVSIILMDIKMPIINGYDAAKKIKENNPNQIIIAQTAYARPEERQKFYDENFDEYIAKPIDSDELLSLLERFVK